MHFPLNGHIVCNDSFHGPGGVSFDFKECRFEPTFYTYDHSENSLGRVLGAINRLRLMEKGIYHWYPKHFGPVIIEQIETKDFARIDSFKLLLEIDNLIDNIQELFFNLHDQPVDRQILKDKVHFILRLIPVDTSIFFKYNVEIGRINTGSTKVVEHNLFDYFFFLIGYNQEKFYLLTLFHE